MDKRIVTGIDIGHNSLKAVVLKPNGEQFALLGYKEILLKDGIVAENNTINHQEIVNTLKQVKKTCHLVQAEWQFQCLIMRLSAKTAHRTRP